MASHSNVLAWRIPGTGEPGGLLSMGSHRVGHDWSDLAAAATALTEFIEIPLPWEGPIGLLSSSAWIFLTQVALVVKNPPASAGDVRDRGSIPGSGRSSGEEDDNPFQYSCLENPMDRGAWQPTVHGVIKSQTWLKQLSTVIVSIITIMFISF